MIARPTRTDWTLLLVLALMWGTSYAFIKLGVQTLPTFTLIMTRLVIGFLFIATVVLIAREPLPRNPRAYLHFAVMAIINIVIPFTLITTAERSVPSSIAAIINGAVPLVVIVLAATFLHDEPITVSRLAGLLMGYAGVIVIVSPGLLSATQGELSGELALVGSTIAYGIGAVYSRRNMRGYRPMIPALFQVAFAVLFVGILAFAFERPLEVSWNTEALIAVLWLGFFGSGAAYLLNFRLLSRIGATRTSILAYFLPIVGIISGALMFGETIDGVVLIGTLLVIGGIALVNAKFGQRQLFGRQPAATAEPGSPAPR
ncbi:MAG TPA: DMT family transporter [Candidatus Limnocylindria bacterium]|nr:DMT family transporter [Candidatus Limnocylindria bacterium]